jgi:hypothetical protein
MTKITPGSIVSGKSGKDFLVDRIEGDTIHSGGFKFLASAVTKVIPPRPQAFKLGDRVEYIGSDFSLKKQYAGELKVWEISPWDGYTCLKPNGRLTSWVKFEDLELSAIESN